MSDYLFCKQTEKKKGMSLIKGLTFTSKKECGSKHWQDPRDPSTSAFIPGSQKTNSDQKVFLSSGNMMTGLAHVRIFCSRWHQGQHSSQKVTWIVWRWGRHKAVLLLLFFWVERGFVEKIQLFRQWIQCFLPQSVPHMKKIMNAK